MTERFLSAVNVSEISYVMVFLYRCAMRPEYVRTKHLKRDEVSARDRRPLAGLQNYSSTRSMQYLYQPLSQGDYPRPSPANSLLRA